MQNLRHIAIIGQGNVSGFLSKALRSNGMEVSVFARNPKTEVKPLEAFASASNTVQLILLCVSDDAIAEVSEQLMAGAYLVAHVSGNVALDAISVKHQHRGVFYPLMSLKASSHVSVTQIPFCIEASSEVNQQLLQGLVSKLKAQSFVVNSAQRRYMHLAAVFAHNFGNFMFTQAQRIMEAQALDFNLLIPLLQQQLETIKHEKARDIQTGPAVRKDTTTIEEHLSLLEEDQRALYTLITKQIQQEYES